MSAGGRYRKIPTRMYSWRKFGQLSRPKPNGQSLFIYLQSGPQTTSIPGLFSIGEAALAEQLRWSMRGFRRVWKELASRRLAYADWRAHVVWVPSVIADNKPENPNVVKGWARAASEIPECHLKNRALKSLKSHIPQQWRGSLSKRFQEPFAKGSTKGLRNQEQEQEQEQYVQERAGARRSAPPATQPALPIVGEARPPTPKRRFRRPAGTPDGNIGHIRKIAVGLLMKQPEIQYGQLVAVTKDGCKGLDYDSTAVHNAVAQAIAIHAKQRKRA